MDSSGVGRFTPLIPGRQRPRPGRGTGRRGRPPGSGKRVRPSSCGREGSRGEEIGFLSPSETNRTLDGSSNGMIYKNVVSISFFWLFGFY